ncbi:Uncharacterised protein [Mycobacteroides abscessus subsp. massiliense]|uniref:hypothetical protein n=1 Tax=Mycobacteroides abscessus TaxID=36809 RepID=UPI0009A57F91|nr:hypothetical protein [Mycobacteroides abscessus]SKD78206.1 Uncharacterised protein [Mycobacteroides abscessus subsp. massiliense]SKO71674.1 Uncharacterised protein [Mycobacteroides abscessus subsp. massiliense]SKY33751.1 Uncharacterised protein [Mycobacteroides abscessus subsp. massiliense]
MGTLDSDGNTEPPAKNDIRITPTPGKLTISMGAATAPTTESKAAAASILVSIFAVTASLLSLVVTILAGSRIATDFGTPFWIGVAVGLTLLLGGTLTGVYRRRQLKRAKAIEQTSQDPKRIGDPVIRRVIKEVGRFRSDLELGRVQLASPDGPFCEPERGQS